MVVLRRVFTLIKVLLSGRCTKEEYRQRNESCNSCDSLVRYKGKRYCGACGCPHWKLAELDSKLWFKDLECPLNKPGFWSDE